MLYMGDALATGDSDRFVYEMTGFAAAGIGTVIVVPSGPEPIAFVEQVAPAVPAYATSRTEDHNEPNR